MNRLKDFSKICTVMVRSVDERTAAACEENLIKMGFDEVLLVQGQIPFTKCIESTFKKAIETDKLWTLCIDADVIVSGKGLEKLILYALQASDKTFVIECEVLDKFTGTYRNAGNHLYRTAFLPKALEFIPCEYDTIRPESFVINRMKEPGFRKERLRTIVIGAHDFEQSYADIYRTAFIYSQKHLHKAHVFLPYWRNMHSQDADFKVALKGFFDGITYGGAISINKDQPFNHSTEILEQLELREKEELAQP
jgi:hypothetical protein